MYVINVMPGARTNTRCKIGGKLGIDNNEREKMKAACLDCSTRLCMAGTAAGFISVFGAAAPPTCYEDVDLTDCFLICGNNMAVSCPVLFGRVMKAKRERGAKIIAVDPRRTPTAKAADLHLPIRPGTDVALNNAMARVLLQEGYAREKEVEAFASGLFKLKQHLEEYTPDKVAPIVDCPAGDIITAASLPHTAWAEEALGKLELLVVQDIFHPTETNYFAHILMPAAQWYEKEGTVITSERLVEYIPKVIDPPGEARPDWKIMQAIAQRMGYGDLIPYQCEEDIFNEWRPATKDKLCDMGGISYDRIRGKKGLQLPCPSENHPGTPRLFTNLRFPRPDGRAALLSRKQQDTAEMPDESYPLNLNTGRIKDHFNTGTRTFRVPRLNKKAGPDGAANLVTNPVFDLNIKQPEYKQCAVRLEKI